MEDQQLQIADREPPGLDKQLISVIEIVQHPWVREAVSNLGHRLGRIAVAFFLAKALTAGRCAGIGDIRRLYQHAIHGARSDLEHLQLRGPHDLRHSFSTWLEDEGIPTRVIDELMGHQRSRGGELAGGSRIGARYRHTTPEMAARVIQAANLRLTIALQVAEAVTRRS